MRFKVKKAPTPGDTRQRIGFAWLPVTIGDVIIWMESYERDEKFVSNRIRSYWSVTSMSLIDYTEPMWQWW